MLNAAEGAYRALLAEDSLLPEALAGLADLASCLGRSDVAVALLERATISGGAVPDLWNALGVSHFLTANHAAAGRAFLRAIVLAPARAAPLYNAAVAAREQGKLQWAAAWAARAGEADPAHPDALTDAAEAARRCGDHGRAWHLLRRALVHDPARYTAWHNLGGLCETLAHLPAETAAYARAIRLEPTAEPSLLNLAACAFRAGDMPRAAALTRWLLALNPAHAKAWYNYGVYLHRPDRLAEEARAYGRAVAAAPTFQPAYYNMSCRFLENDRFSEACRWFRRAAVLEPGDARVWQNFGAALRAQSQVAEAVSAFHRQHRLDPDNFHGVSNLLLGLASFRPRAADEIARAWGDRFPQVARTPCPPGGRRLRIGYVSPDLRQHSCSYFLEPLFSAHDRSVVEIFVYADVRAPDATTARLRASAEHWRDVVQLDDADAERVIRADNLDILVDLAGHTSGNRLKIFSAKPAPIQVTWLGFNATTGLRQIDWKLVDPWIMPTPGAEWFAEGLWLLDRPVHCWRPPVDAPEPGHDVTTRPDVVFGSFNALHKLSSETLVLWARVLSAVPGSRLRLKSLGGHDHIARQRLLASLGDMGISPDRIEVQGWIDSTQSHLAAYHGIDIGLDPFPYHGTTTTCEALWMGVPVVSLAGSRVLSRISISLLDPVGLGDLVAADRDAYVEIARNLAFDASRRRRLRRMLRSRMAVSALRDEEGFARAIETAFAGMMRKAGLA